jgi:RNA polymerase primary sigma factor
MPTGTDWYLDKIGRVPLLTPAEELHLGTIVRAWQDHPAGPNWCPPVVRRRGIRARDRFVTANLRLAAGYVRNRCRHLHRLTEQDDLIQMANLGLVRAVERFDPRRGYKFSTYAYWWLRQSVDRHVDCEARLVRLPGHHSQQIRRLRTIAEKHHQTHGLEPTLHELAAAAGIPVERVRELLEESQAIRSLDCLLDDEDCKLSDTIASDAPRAPDNSPERQELLQHLATLDPLARDVISALWGLHGEPLGPTATAELVGLPGARAVRDVELKALLPLLAKNRQPQTTATGTVPARFAHLLGHQLRLPLD